MGPSIPNLNFNIFWGFQKKKYFGGMKILWGGGGIAKLDYIWGPFLCILGSFIKVKKEQNGNIFGVVKI